MTIIYVTKNNCECYGVTFQNNGYVKVQKFEDISDDKNIIYFVILLETFLGKSKSCKMTAVSGAFNKSFFDGNTILLKIGGENNKHKYVYNGGMICTFLTNDRIYKYISNMGNNLCPYSVATGEKNYYLLAPNFNFIIKEKIDFDTTLDGIYVPDSKESFEE